MPVEYRMCALQLIDAGTEVAAETAVTFADGSFSSHPVQLRRDFTPASCKATLELSPPEEEDPMITNK